MTNLASTFPPAALEHLRRRNLLRTLVEQEVVAEAVQDVAVSEEERSQALQRFYRQADPQLVATQMAKTHAWTPEDLEWQALLPVRVQKYCAEHHAAKAEARFLQRKNDLDQVVYSLVRVKDSALARELYLQVSSGEASMAVLAGQYSEGPERQSSGVVGPKPLTAAHPQLAERLRTAREGELLEPFRLMDWWLVVRLDRYIHATFNEGTALQMARELFEAWVSEETTLRIDQIFQPAPSGCHVAS